MPRFEPRNYKKGHMSTGWQLLEGVGTLLVSIAFAYWLFVAPSRARREQRQKARERRDPREH
jgi:type II secretory pathway component PulM